jgi:hypothetical protein
MDECTKKGLKSSWKVYEVDAVICATGFEIDFCLRFPLIGRNGSIVVALEFITDYFVKLITKIQVENYGSVEPKAGVPEAWLKHTLSWIKKTVWNAGCSNTYRNGTTDQPLFSIHPGSRLHFFQLLLNPRYEDFEWKSLCPDPDLRYTWLGDGFTYDESYKDTKTVDKDQT